MKHLSKIVLFTVVILLHYNILGEHKRIIDSLINILPREISDTTRIKILNDIGGYLITDHDYVKAIYYLDKSEELSKQKEYYHGLCICLNRKGILYLNKNEYKNAKAYFNRALEFSKIIHDPKTTADIVANLGIVYSDEGDYSKALESYMQALKLRENIKDVNGTSRSMLSIANVFYLQGEYKKALEFYLEILKIPETIKNKSLHSNVLYNTGLIFMQLEDYNRAISYFYQCLKIDEEIGDRQGVALVMTNLGTVYSLQNNYNKALELILKGQEILTELGDKRSICETFGELGILYDSIRNKDKAIECFKKQLDIAKEIGSKINIKEAYHLISNHYEFNNNPKEALAFHKLFKQTEDSLKNEVSQKNIAELEAKFETQKKEKEIEMLKTEQALKEAENKRQKQLLFVSFFLAALLALAVFLLYNRRQIKKKSELEKKNFALEKNALSAQMDPHFIFNSLGSISGFISENDKEKAIEYLGVFSRLIRHNLEHSREQLVSVVQETQMLRSYLNLQQLRYNDQFNFEIEIDPSIEDSMAIPPMFVQPFVENAIIHGVIPKNEPGKIKIRFYAMNSEFIICEIEDDGIGKEESQKRKSTFNPAHKSLALKITEERMNIINSMNSEKIVLQMIDLNDKNKNTSGTMVKIKFPMDYV